MYTFPDTHIRIIDFYHFYDSYIGTHDFDDTGKFKF